MKRRSDHMSRLHGHHSQYVCQLAVLAERLAQDPAMRVIVGWQGTYEQAASTNAMSRFETEVLTQGHNLEGLACPEELEGSVYVVQWLPLSIEHQFTKPADGFVSLTG